MRKCVQKWERKRAMALLSRVATCMDRPTFEYQGVHGFIGSGAYNAVYALSADLVLRVEQEPGKDSEGWYKFELCQMYPHVNLPVIWEIGVHATGRRWAIVERLDIQYADLPGVFGMELVPKELTRAAEEHLEKHDVRLSDNHGYNLMRRRKSDVWVIADPM